MREIEPSRPEAASRGVNGTVSAADDALTWDQTMDMAVVFRFERGIQ